MKKKHHQGYGSEYGSGPSSPVVYWSEFENTEEEPYTVPVDETTALLPWLVRRRQKDLERQHQADEVSFWKGTFEKIRDAVEFEVKTSADGLSTLFYEKDGGELSDDDEEDYNSEDSSDAPAIITAESSHRQSMVHRNSDVGVERISRTQLLNRGYSLCVIGCTMLLCLFGIIGLSLNGSATGIAFILVGFLISITLEIVSLVRFIMYSRHLKFLMLCRQGGHSGIAWIGFLVVALAGGAFVPLLAMTQEV